MYHIFLWDEGIFGDHCSTCQREGYGFPRGFKGTRWHGKVREEAKVAQLLESFQSHGLYSPRNSPGQNTGVGSLSLLQGIFPTQGLNPGLPHCRQILYQLSQQGSPRILEWVAYLFSRGSSWPRNRTRGFCMAGGFFTSWAIGEAQRWGTWPPVWQNSTNGNQEARPIQEDISFLLPGGELRGRNSLGDLCRDIARGPREAPTEHLGGGGLSRFPGRQRLAQQHGPLPCLPSSSTSLP